MNAGIADAANLAWLLAARLQGWGAPGILDAYEAERLPITEQVSHFAMNRSEEHTSELQSLMRISYAVFCLQKKKNITYQTRKPANKHNSQISYELTIRLI